MLSSFRSTTLNHRHHLATIRSLSSTSPSNIPPSISFSGAGFLGVYHTGVSQALIGMNLLLPDPPQNTQTQQMLLGSSAGALIASGILCGIKSDDVMNMTIDIAKDAKAAGPLDALTPNFSLLDSLRPKLVTSLNNVVPSAISEGEGVDEYIKTRVNNNRLRVFLTNTETFRGPARFEDHAFVDKFEGLEHVVSACLLSSYIPCATSTLIRKPNDAITAASTFMSTRSVKKQTSANADANLKIKPRNMWFDGGLSLMWPKLNKQTIVVSPLSIKSKNHICICPKFPDDARLIGVDSDLSIEVSRENGVALSRMLWSSEVSVFEGIYRDAYDDAVRVMKENGLVR